MKVKEVVSIMRGLLKEYYPDTRLKNRFLWSMAWVAGLTLIQREKNNIYNSNVFKFIDLEMEEVNLFENSCVPLNCMGCRAKIPKIAENNSGVIYKFLSTPDLSTTFRIVTPSSFTNKKKLIGVKSNYAYIDGDYIYTDKCFPCLKLSYLPGSWEDSLSSLQGCSFLEQESPLPDYLLNSIFRMNLQELNIFIKKPFNHSVNKDTNT